MKEANTASKHHALNLAFKARISALERTIIENVPVQDRVNFAVSHYDYYFKLLDQELNLLPVGPYHAELAVLQNEEKNEIDDLIKHYQKE